MLRVLLEVGTACIEGLFESRDERRSVLEVALGIYGCLLSVDGGVGSKTCDDGVWKYISGSIHMLG